MLTREFAVSKQVHPQRRHISLSHSESLAEALAEATTAAGITMKSITMTVVKMTPVIMPPMAQPRAIRDAARAPS